MSKKILLNFFKKLSSLKIKFEKFFALKVLGRKYLRTGKCNGCGRCCQKIYIRHSKNIIKNHEEFERLKPLHFFYRYLKVIDKDESGLVFECTKLNKETGKCTAYKHRALICRQYPMEEIFMLGGEITEDCGFKFIPIRSFEDVLKEVKSKKKKITENCSNKT